MSSSVILHDEPFQSWISEIKLQQDAIRTLKKSGHDNFPIDIFPFSANSRVFENDIFNSMLDTGNHFKHFRVRHVRKVLDDSLSR